jgi:hypothetical protein
MSAAQSENLTHNKNVAAAEAVRQVAVAGAANQAAVRAAELAFHKSCLASAQANGCGQAPYLTAIKELGTGPA